MDLDKLSDEDYFGHMKMMFRTQGWTILLAELKEQADMISDIQDMTTLEALHYAKGQLNTIGGILNFEDVIRRSEESQEEEEDYLESS